jgi:DNA-binding NtrC family response regulator
VSAAAIGVRVLLVSSDIQIIDTLCLFMEKMAMHVEVCSDFASATRKLCHSKFEALVVDFKEKAAALVRTAPQVPPNDVSRGGRRVGHS